MSAADTGETGLFSGYASLFGIVDLSGDMVLPGAFAASLARRGAEGVKLLWQHDPGVPLGRWVSIAEDGKGLRVTGRLHPDIAKAREAQRLMTAGIVDGLSIGFRTVRARTDGKSGIRRLAEVDLWEISLVTFPLLPGARVTGLGGAGGTSEAAVAARLRAAAEKLRLPA